MIESAEEFIRLRFSETPEEYGRASSEPAAPEVWRDVIDRYPEARFWVAHNKTVPLEILQVLANDPDPKVRSMVASKRKLTPALLAGLATDPDESVRLAVARHKRAPKHVLEQLCTDSWEEVRAMARDRLERGH
ncbi:HEAT repeat domain-containing protein [Streptomyces sp. bgisy032]|uniref:HEAT repeat domain-containing protein n=1 Tax=Streptomyces sp. bgisy032 TaxID=3413773 RepID=UPI003D70F1EE